MTKTKKQLEEAAKNHFAKNALFDTLYATKDGSFFTDEIYARKHSKSRKDITVFTKKMFTVPKKQKEVTNTSEQDSNVNA
jgi:hypothetical protein